MEEKLVGQGYSTLFRMQLFKIKTPATIQTEFCGP